jgi:hypothetical protein
MAISIMIPFGGLEMLAFAPPVAALVLASPSWAVRIIKLIIGG